MGNLDGTTVRTMITRNELDLTDDTQTNESLEAMTKADGVELVRTQTGNNFNIALNTKSAPTDDIHVRKAMAYALDYDQVCESIYQGSTKPPDRFWLASRAHWTAIHMLMIWIKPKQN